MNDAAPVTPAPARSTAVVPEAKPEAKAVVKDEVKPQPKTEAKPEAKSEPKKTEPRKTEAAAPGPKTVDPAAILEGRAEAEPAKLAPKTESQPATGSGNVVIQLAALSDPAKADALKSRLSALGVTAHFSKVETSKGNVTRVRVGPFGSRAEAESVMKKLSSAGVTGIIVNR
jgi:DedD protein